jgi:nitroreductase
MSSVIETIQNRHAVRNFADRPVPDEVLLAILDAGRRSQSSKNSQPCQFVFIILDP